jgi:hypothetical protein
MRAICPGCLCKPIHHHHEVMLVQMQVEGVKGLPNLRAKIAASGPTVLWHGSLGAMSANFVGHYPWCE